MTSCTHSYEIFFYYEKFFHMFSNLSTGNAALHCGSRCEQGYSVCTYMAWNIQLHQPCKMICPGFSKKKQTQNYHGTQQFHFREYTQNWKQGLQKVFVRPCSEQHYPQQPEGEAALVSLGGWAAKQNGCAHRETPFSLPQDTLPHAATRVNLEDIKLSELNQLQKDSHSMRPLIWGTRSHQTPRDRK